MILNLSSCFLKATIGIYSPLTYIVDIPVSCFFNASAERRKTKLKYNYLYA